MTAVVILIIIGLFITFGEAGMLISPPDSGWENSKRKKK